MLGQYTEKSMTSQEMMKAEAKPGYWWVNVSGIGEPPDWVQQVKPQPETNTLFGYEEKAFLRKQYKAA